MEQTDSATAQPTTDGWVNVLTGIGARKDPSGATRQVGPVLLSEVDLDLLYRGDGFAGRIVDLTVNELLREHFEVAGDADGEIWGWLEERGFKDCVAEWVRWSKVFGGAIMVLGLDDGVTDLAMPLNEGRLQDIAFFQVYDRYRLTFSSNDLYTDPRKKGYATPERYAVNPLYGLSSFKVHETRVLRLDGLPVSPRGRADNQGWGDSVLQRMFVELRNVGASYGYSVNLIRDCVQGVMKIDNLQSLLASPEGSRTISRRMDVIDLVRSILNTIIIGSNEEYQRISASVSDVPQLLDRIIEALCAVSGMPGTLLLGRAPGGLSTDDKSGITNWRDRIAGERVDKLSPPLERFARLIQLCKKGPTKGKEIDGWKITFPPLEQMSEKELADIYKINTDADCSLIDRGVLDPEVLRRARWRDGQYQAGPLEIDEKDIKALEEADAEAEAQAEEQAAALAAAATQDPAQQAAPQNGNGTGAGAE